MTYWHNLNMIIQTSWRHGMFIQTVQLTVSWNHSQQQKHNRSLKVAVQGPAFMAHPLHTVNKKLKNVLSEPLSSVVENFPPLPFKRYLPYMWSFCTFSSISWQKSIHFSCHQQHMILQSIHLWPEWNNVTTPPPI